MKFIRFSSLTMLAAAIAAAAPSAPPKTVRDGIAAWQRSDYAAAVAIWRPLAEAGNADAAFNLGQAYRLGRGVSVDLAAAKSWLEKAARNGHLDAQTTLGLLLFDSGNLDAAMQWLNMAAQRGEPRAMLVYGTALFNGDGVPRDAAMAYAYVSRAAAQGLEPAKRTVEEMDRVLPVDVRKKGIAIALGKAKSSPPPSSKPPTKPGPKAAASPPAAKVAAKPVAPPQATDAASGGWRIQLGAFSKRASAEALFAKVSAKLPGHRAYYVAAGRVTRLQVGPYPSRAAAAAACAALSGQACFAVEAK